MLTDTTLTGNLCAFLQLHSLAYVQEQRRWTLDITGIEVLLESHDKGDKGQGNRGCI